MTTQHVAKNAVMMPYNFSVLTTARLRLRQWRAEDLETFAALDADPRVIEHDG